MAAIGNLDALRTEFLLCSWFIQTSLTTCLFPLLRSRTVGNGFTQCRSVPDYVLGLRGFAVVHGTTLIFSYPELR